MGQSFKTEDDVLQYAAKLIAARNDAENSLRDLDNEIREVIKTYSIMARVWGFDRHKLRIVCELRGFLPKFGEVA